MNHHSDTNCRYCGSSMHRRFGRPHCSGDNLKATKSIFDGILQFEQTDPHYFGMKVEDLSGNEEAFDLFMHYWRDKRKDPEAPLDCIHAETYFRNVTPEPAEIPMPDPFIPFPDLAEVYLAEIMLGRELTDLEKEGSRHIPKISEEGDFFWAPLTWITFPHGYMSRVKSDGRVKTLEPMKKVFDIDDIRGKYADKR